MNNPRASGYAQRLQKFASEQAVSHALDKDELAANRKLKRKRVAPGPDPAPAPASEAPRPPPTSVNSPSSQPGSSEAGPSADENAIPGEDQPASDAQPVAEDEEMVDQSDEEEPIEGATPGETAYLNRLKDLYAQQPNKATQKALLSVLEQLAREAGDGERQRKRRKRGPNSDAPWDQDQDQEDDYFCTDGPQRREQQRVALSGYIRIILGQLLKLKDKKTQLPPGPPPEVAAPTATAFYVKWGESEKSEFNATAARIVAKRVVEDYPTLCTLDEMHDMVTCHLKYLRTRHRRQTDPRYMVKERDRLHRSSVNTRKRTLYLHRLRIINAVLALARHGRLIETLGIEGTSSDEEDATHKGVYFVKRRKQLSSKVRHLKRKLDMAYSIHFKGPGSKGNQLRKRVDTGVISNRRLKITGLPISCMDQTWLATLTDIQKEMYELREMEYDFTFPEELLKSPEEM
ncbi:hypothetical protein FRC06_008531 [Ceratobasidium sp. 370]|nr:hypothetical protein FRC06_008531 [Ceratobasidium sp. 370]